MSVIQADGRGFQHCVGYRSPLNRGKTNLGLALTLVLVSVLTLVLSIAVLLLVLVIPLATERKQNSFTPLPKLQRLLLGRSMTSTSTASLSTSTASLSTSTESAGINRSEVENERVLQ